MPDDPRTKVLEKIERQTFRAAKIVNGLLNLARPAQVDSGPVDLHAVINDVLALLDHQFRTGSIQVRKELCASTVVVQGIEYKLQQVFLNLFLNARDAMPKGGWLTIVTKAEGAVGGGRNRRYRVRDFSRTALADLRSVLHDQGDRQGHRPRPVDHLRDRAGARRHDHLRQLHRQGHALHARAAARVVAGRRGGARREQAGLTMARAVPSDAAAARLTGRGSILVIDDEEIMREILEALLTREGYEVRLAAGAAEGLELIRSIPFDAAIVDMMMPGMDGISTLDELKKIDDDLPVLMITAFASVENAIAAMKRGAYDYITKPFKNDEVLVVLRNALAQRRLVAENRALRQNLQARANRFGEIIGRSSRMRQVFDLIIQAAPSRTTILINGESGTGKELVARSLHQNSSRSDRAFITVNSGNLPPDLLESNLFGHVKGAFTGAVYPKKGLFELADKGTIFFDEIGNIPLETQAKLLRVIQEREFMRLGGVETIKVDVRIIAATNVDLRHMMEEGRFREDLYYRLHVITVQLPPLRERKDDIPLLVQHFLEKYGAGEPEDASRAHRRGARSADGVRLARQRPRARERRRARGRAVHRREDRRRSRPRSRPQQQALPDAAVHRAAGRHLVPRGDQRLREAADRDRTLEAAGGVQKRAAELLHIKPTTLNEMIKRYEIRPRRKRGALGSRPGADVPDIEDVSDDDPDTVGAVNRE